MKTLKDIISEKLTINSKTKIVKHHYNYCPKTKEELLELIGKLIKERGDNADLNDIDVSNITNMAYLFDFNFNGNISEWDVSNVEDMSYIFWGSKFNNNISEWNVSKVTNMERMFAFSKFDGDISNWDVSNVKNMKNMFYKSPLEKNPPKWYKK